MSINMTDRPQLSVIVITHNREDQVVECVLLLSRLEAGATDPELIVVLDSCSDRSLERLSSLRTEIGSRLVLESIQANSPAVARTVPDRPVMVMEEAVAASIFGVTRFRFTVSS